MEYRCFSGSVEYSGEDELFFGKVMFIRALISYEGTDAESIQTNFHEAVDDYLELCALRGIQPEPVLPRRDQRKRY